jgi:hypothetical protein
MMAFERRERKLIRLQGPFLWAFWQKNDVVASD